MTKSQTAVSVLVVLGLCSPLATAQPRCTATTIKSCMPQVGPDGVIIPISAVPTTAFLTYYWTPTASSPTASYLQMTNAPYSPKTGLTTSGIPNGTTLLQTWATNAGIPNLAAIPAGPYQAHIHVSRTGTGGTLSLYAEFWEVTSAEVNVGLIGTSEATGQLTTSETEYVVDYVNPNTHTMASSSSRLVTKIYAVRTGGAGPDVTLYVGGTADSHTSLPTNAIDASNFVPYAGAVYDLNMGVLSIDFSTANEAVTGTTQYKLAKLTGAPSTAIRTATTDTTGIVGIVVSSSGTTGNAAIARFGNAPCVFDGATTAGDFVQNSTTVAGDCHDAGTAIPLSGQVVGRVLSTNGGGGTYSMLIFPGVTSPATYRYKSTFTNSGSVIAPGSQAVGYNTVAAACTAGSYNIGIFPSGTATFDVWKVVTGTALPAVGNTIISGASYLAISSNTYVRSTNMSSLTTTTFAVNDILGFKLQAVTGSPTMAFLEITCQ